MKKHPQIDNIVHYELQYRFSKSSGSGGQNINKRNTKAELYFNITDSRYLTDDQKKKLIKIAGNMVHHKDGMLIMMCQEERLQWTNKKKLIVNFRTLLLQALQEDIPRIATKIPPQEREIRLSVKSIQSQKKELRKKPSTEE